MLARGKTELAYGLIKAKIMEGQLAPLMDITEDDLQKELSISRTPIREAILRLQKEGFVYIYPRKGTIVSEVTPHLIHEIYQMRELNEPFIAVQASRNMPRDVLLHLKQRLTQPPEMGEGELRRYFIDLDRELHGSILACCGNRFLQDIMGIVYDHNHRIRIKASNPDQDRDESISEHIRIVDALLARDLEGIKQEVLLHVHNSKQISMNYFNPEGLY